MKFSKNLLLLALIVAILFVSVYAAEQKAGEAVKEKVPAEEKDEFADDDIEDHEDEPEDDEGDEEDLEGEDEPETKYASGKFVESLNKKTYGEFLKKHEFVLVEYYAPWCPHCKSLAPHFAKAAEHFKDSTNIKLADVDCDSNQDICNKENIPGFPTMKLFKNGKEIREFEEGRTAEDIIRWLSRRTGPSVVPLESDKVADFLEKNKKAEVSVVLGQFKDKTSGEYKTFVAAADIVEDLVFGEVIGKDEGVALYPYFNSDKVKVAKEDNTAFVDASELANYLKGKAYPLIDEINAKSFQRYSDSGLPTAVLFLKYDDSKEETLKVLNKAAKALEGKMMFSYSDGEEYGSQLEMMGGDPSKLPALAAMEIEKRLNFPYNGELNPDSVLKWAEGIVEGSIKPFFKSQPIPKEPVGEDGVTVVVGKSFGDIVLDETKDVLVEFYASWCTHCKQLAPKYSKLAKFFKDATNLVIAKIEATENDIPDSQVEGFPTIFFYPNNNKKNPISFEGSRTLKGFQKFLLKEAVASKDQIKEILKAAREAQKKTQEQKKTEL